MQEEGIVGNNDIVVYVPKAWDDVVAWEIGRKAYNDIHQYCDSP